MRLEGKVAIVVGAGSSGPGMGNGKATALLFDNVGGAWGGVGLNISGDDWDGIMTLNVKSIVLVCKYAVPKMIENGGGAIVNNASMAGFYAQPTYASSTST